MNFEHLVIRIRIVVKLIGERAKRKAKKSTYSESSFNFDKYTFKMEEIDLH